MNLPGATLNFCAHPMVRGVGALIFGLGVAACELAPQYPTASAGNPDPKAISGTCVWVQGNQILGKGFHATNGDMYWTNGHDIYALLNNGNIAVTANYTVGAAGSSGINLWQAVGGSVERERGLDVTGVWSLNPKVGTPSREEVMQNETLRGVAFQTQFVSYQAEMTRSLASLGNHVCPPVPLQIGGGGSYYPGTPMYIPGISPPR